MSKLMGERGDNWRKLSRDRSKKQAKRLRSENEPDPSAIGRHTLLFGRHKGKTLAEVHRVDPSYLAWAARTFGGTTGRLIKNFLA